MGLLERDVRFAQFSRGIGGGSGAAQGRARVAPAELHVRRGTGGTGAGESRRPPVASETRRQSGGCAAQPADHAGPCRDGSRRRKARIQSRTVLRGTPWAAAIRRLPAPRADSVSARPMDPTSSSRRRRHDAGRSTWVRPQARHRARLGWIQRSRPPKRRSRGRAHPHRRSRPGPQEQRNSPASSARVTSAADSRTMRISACRPSRSDGDRPVGHRTRLASQALHNACRGMSRRFAPATRVCCSSRPPRTPGDDSP